MIIYSMTNPFMYWIHANGRKRTEDGGERIVIPLEYGKNDTIKSMTSGYDTIDTTPQEHMTSAYYQWKKLLVLLPFQTRNLLRIRARIRY